jgi:hypothetical protein
MTSPAVLRFRPRPKLDQELSRYAVHQPASTGDPGGHLGYVVRVHVGWAAGHHLSAWHAIDREGHPRRSGLRPAQFGTRDEAGLALLPVGSRLPAGCDGRQAATVAGWLIPGRRVAGPDPAERRVADGAALYCCAGQQAHGRATWRVLLRRTTPGGALAPAESDDEQCPECGTAGQQVSEARVWARA